MIWVDLGWIKTVPEKLATVVDVSEQNNHIANI